MSTAGDLASLLRWLSRVRSLSELSSPEATELAAPLNLDAGATPEEILARVDQAIAGVQDETYRRAAVALLGSGPNRWTGIKHRQRLAGQEFGVGADAFRRRRSDGGASREQETLEAVARSVSQMSATAAEVADVRHSAEWRGNGMRFLRGAAIALILSAAFALTIVVLWSL